MSASNQITTEPNTTATTTTTATPAARAVTPTHHKQHDPESQSGVSSFDEKVHVSEKNAAQQDVLLANAHHDLEDDQKKLRRKERMSKARPFILGGIAVVILGWWISSIVLPATRHRWCVSFPPHICAFSVMN